MARKPRRKPPAKLGPPVTLIPDRLGGGGDAMAGNIAIPYGLPGETLLVRVAGDTAEIVDILEPSAERQPAACPHFGLPGDACGGCHVQQMGLAETLRWKTDRLAAALSRTGLALPPIDAHQSPLRSRRRAKVAMDWEGRVGFRRYKAHKVVPMRDCAILAPELFAVITALGEKGSPVRGWRGEAHLTLTGAGVDVDLRGHDEGDLDLSQREGLTDLANRLDLARLSVGNVPLTERRTPQLSLGGLAVPVPPASFLQATAAGEAALTEAVLAGVGEAREVADLFCGLGTFAGPLSEGRKVLAADSDGPAIAALDRAARAAGRSLTAQRRNLFEAPLRKDELAGFDAVVLDPPRAGAAAQFATLAEAEVPRIVAVSCNPQTLARDIASLAGRYDMTALTLVDQFLFTPHIEAVAVLERRR